MSDALLELDNLRIALNGKADQEVVKGVSLSIRPGQTMCLVGESGSGKSLSALATMGLLPKALQASGGSIRLKGEELLNASASRLRALRATEMSMIFQEPMTALNPVMRVGDQIQEVLEAHADKMEARARRARALEIMEEVHLPDPERMIRAYPHQLSGGQRQRIMIAMALVMKPQLLIADEPTTALDVTTQAQILKLIRELREKEGTAVLFITHDMGVVADIADDVTVLKLGEVMETRPVDDLLRTPQTDYTRELLRAVPSQTPRPPRPGSEEPVVLSTKDLRKVYADKGFLGGKTRETVAAKDVSFSLRRGRTLGIVGESGSGKSTVARCIVRLIEPTSGEITIAGQNIAPLTMREMKPHRRNVQIVFQDPMRSLNPRIEVGESIIEGPTNFGVPRAKAMERARELLELVGLPASAVDRFPHQFSGGQRQRIAIARALAMDPEVLIADEAVSALDVSVQAQVLELLDEIQQRLGVAILFITHDLGVAAQICDEVMVMQKGEVVEYGPAGEVLGAPKHDYTRALIEAAPGRHWDFANFRPFSEGDGAPASPAVRRPVRRKAVDIAALPFDTEEMLAGLRPWVECESPTWDRAAVNRMMDLASRDLAIMGARVERIPGRMGLGDVVRAKFPHPHEQEKGILILGHMDTVHPVGTLAKLPWRREGELCYGPGIYDMKGGNYLALEAIRQLARAGVETHLPVTVMFTPDEEIGTPSMRDLIEAEAARSKYVLVPEPGRKGGGVTSGRYAIARFNIETKGRPSHAGARLSEGRSAIREMAKRIIQIEEMTSEACTFSVGVMHSGQWVNCVSSHAEAEVLTMAKRQEDLDQGVERMLALSDPDGDAPFIVKRGVTRPVWEPDAGVMKLVSMAEGFAKKLGSEFYHESSGGGSDGNFTGAMGVPTLDGLGVEGDKLHTLEEHIFTPTLAQRGRIMAGMLADLE